MNDHANLVDASDVETFADHAGLFTSAQKLMQSLEAMIYAAQERRQLDNDT